MNIPRQSLRIILALFIVAFSLNSYAWTIHADFEQYAPGDLARGPDAFSGSTNDRVDDSIQAYSGENVVRIDIAQNVEGFGTFGGILDFPTLLGKGDEVWYKVSVFFPQGFFYDARPWLKFMRIRTPRGHLDWYISNSNSAQPFRWIYEGEQVWETFGETRHKIQYGRWETYEMYINLDDVPRSEGGEGLVRVWKDGELIGEFDERQTLATPDVTANYALLFTYWNGSNSPAQHWWADDIIITNETPSRRDAHGNPFIGVSGANPPARPSAILRSGQETFGSGN